jgi:hypothetical protein
MKPLIVALLGFGLCFVLLFFWALGLTFPIPGNEPLPEAVIRKAEFGEFIFRFLACLSPYRPAHDPILASVFGAGVWTALLSCGSAFAWKRRKKKPNQSLVPTPMSVTSPAAQEPRRP